MAAAKYEPWAANLHDSIQNAYMGLLQKALNDLLVVKHYKRIF